MNLDIYTCDDLRVVVKDEDGGVITSQTVEANILFAILEKLEEIRCGIVDVENKL